MIVAADYFGFIDGRHLTWTLAVSGDDAAVDVNWNPPLPNRASAAVSFKIPEMDIPHSFSQLQSRYSSSLDGASVRSLSASIDGVIYRCTVHGNPSLDDHPELGPFNDVWRSVFRLVHAELELYRGG